jgi:Ankyrin repeats (3 copies)
MSELQLIEAVKAADVTAAKELIQSGADINQQDEQGWTPLNWAAGKGKLAMVELLVEAGADIFKVGRDQRTPYMIALAAGHADVVKFLSQAEERVGGGPTRPERKYCKAYHLKDFRQFSGWTENSINLKEKTNDSNGVDGGGERQEFSDDDIAFLHQDYSVTQSMWHNENVIFNQVTPEWKQFCATELKFKVPDDLDLIVSAKEADAQA